MIPSRIRPCAAGWRRTGLPSRSRVGWSSSIPTIWRAAWLRKRSYAWIKNNEHRPHWESHLRRRGKRPSRRKNTVPGQAARIDQRPEVIEQRLRLGDFEGDTVLGPPGTGGLATLVDRRSRYTIVVKIQSKHAQGNRILISGESAQNAFQEVFVPARLEPFASDASF